MKKTIVLLFAFFVTINLSAQKKTFLRIYDLQGKKINKGFFAGTTDSTLLIINKDAVIDTITLSQIGKIKTRHSLLSPILITSLTFGLLAGAAGSGVQHALNNSNSYPVIRDIGGPVFPGLFAVGAAAGALVGALISALQHRLTFTINGDKDTWQIQRAEIDKLPLIKTLSNNY